MTVVGSAEFELRANKAKLARDVRGAEADLKRSVEKVEKDYARAGQKSADAFGVGTRKMAGHADDAAKAVGRSSGLMTAALGGVATAAASVGFAAIIQGARDVAAAGADIQKTADSLNVGTTRLQELRYAATEAKVSLRDLEGGLGKLNTLLGEFRAGIASRDIEPVFDRLGIKPEDLQSIQDADQFLALIADRLVLVGDNAEKAALLDKLQIEGLLPLLKLGSDGINDLAGAASNLGGVIESDMVARLAEADAQLQRSATQMDNLRILALAPLADWFGVAAEAAAGFIVQMSQIESRSSGWQKAIAGGLRALPGGTATSLMFQRLVGGPPTQAVPDDVDDPARLRARMAASRPVRGYQPQAPRRARTGGSSARTGPTPEELQAQREMLSLQGQIEVLRAQGRSQEAQAAQRRLDVLNLTRQYERAGFENAKALAEGQVNAIARATAAQEALNRGREEGQRWLSMAEEAQRANADATLDRARYEAEIAYLSGNPRAIEKQERELYIAERVNELLRDKVGLITAADVASATSIATQEADALGSADREGRLRDEFRRSFVDGMRSAIDGDVGGLFESLADRFSDRMLENLADDLFDLLQDAGKGGGGGFLGSIFGGLKSLIPGFSSGVSNFGGGLAYVHKDEMLMNLSKGTSVIPAHAVRAMGAMAGGMGAAGPVSSPYFDLRGAVMTQDLLDQMNQIGRTSETRANSWSTKHVPGLSQSQTAKQQQYTVGRKKR
jgi:hypothetical protein